MIVRLMLLFTEILSNLLACDKFYAFMFNSMSDVGFYDPLIVIDTLSSSDSTHSVSFIMFGGVSELRMKLFPMKHDSN
jgi:hypothetical protein